MNATTPVERRVQAAAKGWRSSLINISGANRLLFYRDLRVGTLGLTTAPSAAVAALLDGKSVRLSRLCPGPNETAAGVRSLKAITAKARVAAEEFGVHLTFVATGFATWDPIAAPVLDPAETELEPRETDGSAASPSSNEPSHEKRSRPKATAVRAPVLLRPLQVTPRPGSIDGFDLQVTGEAQVNPVLLHLLEAQYGIRVDDLALLEQATDDDTLFAALAARCGPDLPGFVIAPEQVIGNFYYAEQPLVDDLSDDQVPFLASCDLIAALAGDDTAAAAVREAGSPVSMDAPDHRPPSTEFLVLDADGSQSYVINAVVAGQNLVVQGPPGTGKSQTIANVIAELIARNKRVLFVAQKRAAIEAVLSRLEQVKLDHLVMDLFTTASSRKAVVAEVGRAVDQRRTITRPRVEALHDRLVQTRNTLVASRAAMHEPRQPWGVSLAAPTPADGTPGTWGLYDWAVANPRHVGRRLRLDLGALTRWTEATHETLRAVVSDFVATGGTSPTIEEPGWSLARLTDQAAVVTADEVLVELTAHLAAVRPALDALADAIQAPRPVTPADASYLIGLVGASYDLHVAGFGQALHPDTTDDLVAQQLFALGTRAQRKASSVHLGMRMRRRVARATTEAYPSTAPADIWRSLAAARQLRRDWARLIRTPPSPPYPQAPALRESWTAVEAGLSTLVQFTQGLDLFDLTLPELAAALDRLGRDGFHRRFPRLHQLRDDLVAQGCGALVQEFLVDAPTDPDDAADRLSHAWAMTVIDYIDRTDGRLFGIDSAVRDRATTEFVVADIGARDANAHRVARVAAEHLAEALGAHPDQAEVLRDQLRRKRGFRPVRQLLTDAPDVMLAAKPVWAASPQAVSELLPSARLFDVVIFDEASQVQPAAALPAIARGHQTVVAGDSLQLPPTTLFTRTVQTLDSEEDSAYEDDPDAAPTGVVSRDMESILDAVEVKLGTQRSKHLSWHYRSRDERLIATSNTWVYRPRGRLMTTFPAADGATSLRHVVVPASKGLGPNNLSPAGEVTAVVELVLEHASASPDQSLGVISFGQQHADRISGELEKRLATADEAVRAWFAPSGPEPFFVKNIERVQGDERSKIILTVGYTRGDDGKLRYSWGPVHQDGGHRRINVAISRARSDLVLVTSFAAEDVDERAGSAEGFQLMRRFITFASTGGDTFGDAGADGTPLNPFEFDILRRLHGAGLDATPQYGVGSYRLDFAVRHPDEPGRFVLAVEADGAAYHSGVVARERDRLRQSALEARGWTFVRIWSTDYFRDPDAQIARVVTAYEQALRNPTPAQPSAPSSAVPPQESQPVRGPRPRVWAGLPIGQYTDRDLDEMVRWVRSDDMVHTPDEVFEMVKRELGFQRNGGTIVARIEGAVRRAM